MEVERIADAERIALYSYDWDLSSSPATKINRRFIGYEQNLRSTEDARLVNREAICWSYGRTLGNIAVFSEELLGFRERSRAVPR